MRTLEERWREANTTGDTATGELLAELMDAQALNDSDELEQATDELKSLRDQLYRLIASINATLKEIE